MKSRYILVSLLALSLQPSIGSAAPRLPKRIEIATTVLSASGNPSGNCSALIRIAGNRIFSSGVCDGVAYDRDINRGQVYTVNGKNSYDKFNPNVNRNICKTILYELSSSFSGDTLILNRIDRHQCSYGMYWSEETATIKFDGNGSCDYTWRGRGTMAGDGTISAKSISCVVHY